MAGISRHRKEAVIATKPITKAIICAAGQGTRFLPMTKALPKEMLPIIDKPIIQYVVEGAVAAGVTDVIIVGNANKRAIEDHFDHQVELETALRAKGKHELADRTHAVAELANFVYIRQKGQYGNGTPVLNAAHLLDDEPFMVLFADDFFMGAVPQPVQLAQAYAETGRPVLSVIPVAADRAASYGIADLGAETAPGTYTVKGLVEKPAPADTPTHNGQAYASVSGYVLTPDFMEYLKTQGPGNGGEIVLADAINRLSRDADVFARVIDGTYLDCGSPEKFLEATVAMALADPAVGPGFRDYLRGVLK